MKIVFDGYWWARGPFSNRTVLVNLIDEWRKIYPDDHLTVICPGISFGKSVVSGIRCIKVPWLPHPLFNLLYINVYRILSLSDCSLVQNFGTLSRKSLVFIQDVIFLEKKDWFTKLELLYFSLIPRLAKIGRDGVLASSNSEARRIQRHVKTKNITAVGLGVRRSLTNAVAIRPKSLQTFQGPFYFTVVRNNPRKNLSRLIQAHELAKEAVKDFPNLVIVGVTREERPSIGLDTHVESSIMCVKNLTDSELRWLYQNGDFTTFLSLDEGFGLPIKEADFFRTPQLASDIEVFREVSSNSVMFVNPLSVEEIKDKLIDLACRKREIECFSELDNRTWEPVISRIREKLIAIGKVRP